MLYNVRFLLAKVFFGSLLITAALTAGGCAFMSDEDRDFYGKGWVKPSALDKPMPHHTIQDPSHPEYYREPTDAPAQTAAATPEPQWLIPEQAPR